MNDWNMGQALISALLATTAFAAPPSMNPASEAYRAHLAVVLSGPATLRAPHGLVTTRLDDVGLLELPGDRLCIDDVSEVRFRPIKPPLDRAVLAGKFPVKLVVARGPAAQEVGGRVTRGEFTALSYVAFRTGREAQFVPARYTASTSADDPQHHLVQADGGFCALFPAGLNQASLQAAGQTCLATLEPLHSFHHAKAFTAGNRVFVVRPGLGPGGYPIWWGLDASGKVISVVVDFQVLGVRVDDDAWSGYRPYPKAEPATK